MQYPVFLVKVSESSEEVIYKYTNFENVPLGIVEIDFEKG